MEWVHAKARAHRDRPMIGGTAWIAVQLLILVGALVVAVIALIRAFHRR
jgi:hypothetical protein